MKNTSSSRFQLIQELSNHPDNSLRVVELCQLNGVSRSGYYRWLRAASVREAREQQDRKDFDLILTVYRQRGYSKGARSIHMAMLHMDPPVVMNVKKIHRLMNKYNLRCPIRKANPYRRMAQALKTSHTADNLVARQFEAYGPRMILLTDITYIPYAGTFAYLSTILDAYTKQILAYVVSDSLQENFVLETVRRLIRDHGITLTQETVLHSDQGCHYTSIQFIELVKSKRLRQSMSRKGNCWDNAPQESFFGHMKDEIGEELGCCQSFEQVQRVIDDWMEYYNNERYVWDLAKLAPNEFYEYIRTGEYPIKGIEPAPTLIGKSGEKQE